jgi:hypothetical protein
MQRKEARQPDLSSATPRPRPAGVTELGALIPKLTRPAFRKANPAAAQIMADWLEIVGPGTLSEAQPVRLSQGALTLACSGPLALEISMLAPQVIARINAHLGRAAVTQLKFVQAVSPAAPAPVRRRRQDTPPVELPGEVQARLADMPEGPLRDALERLGQAVFKPEAVPVPLGPLAAVKVVGKVKA